MTEKQNRNIDELRNEINPGGETLHTKDLITGDSETRQKKRMIIRTLFRSFDENERRLPLLTRIVESGWNNVDLLEQYDEMIAWCSDHGTKKASMMRYYNWIKRALEWKKNKESSKSSLEEKERAETKEFLKKYKK